jgi:phosphatidylglycerophosphate synthase
MLDGLVRGVIDPPLDRSGRWLAARGASADVVTLAGLGLGLMSAALIAFGWSGLVVLVLLLASRLADGLDGAVARVHGKSDFGGFLDIAADFAFYGAIPLAFVLRDPEVNGLAGAFLLFSFYVNGSTFLAFAAVAARRGMETRSRGEKSLYFTAGLLEGTETIVYLAVLAVFPAIFVPSAWVFGGLCLMTAVARILLARRTFR